MIEIKSLMTEKVLQTIFNNYKMALNVLQTESFDVYNFIKEEFKKTDDVTKNHLFQFVYRSFYRLDNAGLTPELKTKYFDLLQEYRNKDIDLKNICLDLYEYKTRKDKNSIQFSFVTKLANTIDSSYPIYDSEVIKLFDFKQPYYLKEKNSKIDKYLEQYQYILFTSNELIKNEKVLSIFDEMNELFGSSCINMSNSKKLDTLMWGVGKVLID